MSFGKISLVAVVGLALGVGGCAEKKTEPVVKPGPTFSTVDIAIAGMHCDGCAMTINDALKETDGVVECQVSFQAKKATVKYDPTRVAPSQLAAVIEKSGYKSTLPGAPAKAGESAAAPATPAAPAGTADASSAAAPPAQP